MTCIPEARKRFFQFPHQLSGGMRQRVMIAMALAKDPRLLVADEPTTALDPTVRRSILALLQDCLDETGAACLCITHDWDAARQLCDTAAIMYAGHILEAGSVQQVLDAPRHPYVKALRQAMEGERPRPIPGQPPALTDNPSGCRFQPRCIHSGEACAAVLPPLNGGVRCHNHL
jgi:oligopeptide/dipeptide ABC transporter ATP-binding protein